MPRYNDPATPVLPLPGSLPLTSRLELKVRSIFRTVHSISVVS